VGVIPLGTPNRRSLGKPLPYQLADGAQAAPLASCDFNLAITLSIAPPFGGISSTKGTFLGITHPFAVGLNPLDLHVLGTPPAFILSQDQTLNRTVMPFPEIHRVQAITVVSSICSSRTNYPRFPTPSRKTRLAIDIFITHLSGVYH
jgi:hypothetical protein